MTREYKETIDPMTNQKIISYEENGFLYSFIEDPANSDYQRYLNRDAEPSTPPA
jgi:hypothetical protein